MENIKNFIKSNWYIREPVHDSNVRVCRTYEGFYLGLLAISPVIIALSIGIIDKVGL